VNGTVVDDAYETRGCIEFTLTDKKEVAAGGFNSNLKPNYQKLAFSSKGSVRDASANQHMNSGSKYTLTDMV